MPRRGAGVHVGARGGNLLPVPLHEPLCEIHQRRAERHGFRRPRSRGHAVAKRIAGRLPLGLRSLVAESLRLHSESVGITNSSANRCSGKERSFVGIREARAARVGHSPCLSVVVSRAHRLASAVQPAKRATAETTAVTHALARIRSTLRAPAYAVACTTRHADCNHHRLRDEGICILATAGVRSAPSIRRPMGCASESLQICSSDLSVSFTDFQSCGHPRRSPRSDVATRDLRVPTVPFRVAERRR